MKARRAGSRRRWAWPLVPLYATVVAVKNGLRRLGLLRTRGLRWPVVSVGSLSAGGAGKTPVVIALAELLRDRGWVVDVLSRGYGREGRGVERVDPDADGAAARFGDEPVMLARRAGVPVWVGAERFAAGREAEASIPVAGGHLRTAGEASSWGEGGDEHLPGTKAQFDFGPGVPGLKSRPISEAGAGAEGAGAKGAGAEGVGSGGQGNAGVLRFAQNDEQVRGVHLLDDGFQHRRLARAVDVVLVTEEDFHDALLPAGNLREPLTALRRADVVVLREDERERVEPRVRKLMREGAVVWTVRRGLRFPDSPDGSSAGSRPVAFCAIARPEGFWAMLSEAGAEAIQTMAFGDHHTYTEDDVERMVRLAKNCNATGFITTEKDAVKLSTAMLERLREVGPVSVAGLEVKFVDEADVLRELEARIS